VEDMTGFFHMGLAASVRPNSLNQRGVRTSLEPGTDGRISIPYIQGVARIPREFDCVNSIIATRNARTILLVADSGSAVEVPCFTSFIETLDIPNIGL
jgi:hypothetical protein